MEVTQGNMVNLFTGLRGNFLDAVRDAKPPEAVADFVLEMPSSKATEQYPTAALLGDLELLLDELAMTNLGEFMQDVENQRFERGYSIPRDHVEDENLGMYPQMSASLGARAASHAYRNVPNLFGNGFATAWVDGANVFASNHVWPGGQVWDNLDNLPLTQGGFEVACEHLMIRLGPDGKPMDLTPTHLIVGPRNWWRAKRLLQRGFVGGGNTNIHYESVKPVKWSRLAATTAHDWSHYWFVVDASPEQPKSCVYQLRSGPEFVSRTALTDEPVFTAERFEYKGAVRYGLAVVCPWLIQAVQATEDSTTTSGAAR